MKKLWIVFVIGLLALILVGCKGTAAENPGQHDMSSLINKEMTANDLYTELAERYPEDEMFADMAEESAGNMEALEEEAARLGISIEDAKAEDIEIPGTKGDALTFAVLFEQADIRMLNKMIKNEEDDHFKKVKGDLLKSSENNYSVLKKASEKENPLVVRGCTRCRTTQGGQSCPMQNYLK